MRLRLQLMGLFVMLSSLGACSAQNEATTRYESEPAGELSQLDPIVGGSADKADPAVVAIDIDGEGLCSGTLIGPRAVLTARHCVSYTTDLIYCPAWGPQIEGEREPSGLSILVGHDVSTARRVAWGKEVLVPDSDVLCGQDLAIVLLDREVQGVKPLAVSLEEGVFAGQEVRIVGFGKRGDHLGSGKKYARDHVTVLRTTSDEFVIGEGTCQGDSGGPALDSATGAVLGVISRGGPYCQGSYARNIYTRVDAFPALIRAAAGVDGGMPSSHSCGPGKRCPNGFHCGAELVCEPVR